MSSVSFNKYRDKGAYHYKTTLGARVWREFDIRTAARYQTGVRMLNPVPGQLILDAGSGEGVAAILCCRRGSHCLAIEQEKEACELGQALREAEGIAPERLEFRQEDLYHLTLKSSSVDGVVSLEVIEHMDDVGRYLGELRRVLKPAGRVVFSTPLKRSDGTLQDPYHVQEFDARSLELTLLERFNRVEVFSAWPAWLQTFYDTNWPHLLVGKIKRGLIKSAGFWGLNVFVGPRSVNQVCPLLLARAWNTHS